MLAGTAKTLAEEGQPARVFATLSRIAHEINPEIGDETPRTMCGLEPDYLPHTADDYETGEGYCHIERVIASARKQSEVRRVQSARN